MYSQAHISLFNIYWRVWLLVIRGPEKANLGSMEASGKQCISCIPGGGKGPSLDCAVKEECGNPGRNVGLSVIGSHFTLVIFVLKQRSKGHKRILTSVRTMQKGLHSNGLGWKWGGPFQK